MSQPYHLNREVYRDIKNKSKDQMEQYIGRKVTRLKAPHSYEWYMFEIEKQKGKNVGTKGYGWARMWQRWCTQMMKQKPTAEHLKTISEYISYIGIAYDEPKRHESRRKNDVHPLYDWHITEAEALSYCKRHSFNWGGLYDDFKRVSCWCCPLQPMPALRTLYHKYPTLWARLKAMDDKVQYKFRPDYSVQQLEDKFKREDYLKKISIPLFDVNTDDM